MDEGINGYDASSPRRGEVSVRGLALRGGSCQPRGPVVDLVVASELGLEGRVRHQLMGWEEGVGGMGTQARGRWGTIPPGTITGCLVAQPVLVTVVAACLSRQPSKQCDGEVDSRQQGERTTALGPPALPCQSGLLCFGD